MLDKPNLGNGAMPGNRSTLTWFAAGGMVWLFFLYIVVTRFEKYDRLVLVAAVVLGLILPTSIGCILSRNRIRGSAIALAIWNPVLVAASLLLLPSAPLQPAPDAVPWRILSVIILRTELSKPGGEARLTDDDVDLIQESHRRFEQWLIEKTAGAIAPSTTFLIQDGPVTTLSPSSREENEDEETKYWLAGKDIPKIILKKIHPASHQSLFVWVSIPPGVPRGGGAMTGSWVRGIPYSCMLPNRPVLAGVVGLSHEFYHQVTRMRSWVIGHKDQNLPSNHPPNTIHVEGTELLPAGDTREEWYRYVLRHRMPRTAWKEMADWQDRESPSAPGNLAFQADAIADATVAAPGRINDGMLTKPAETAPPSRLPVSAWFGLEWEQPVRISKVRAYLTFSDSDLSSYAAQHVVLERYANGRWEKIPGTERSGILPDPVEIEFAALSLRKLRAVILKAAPDRRGFFYRVVCRELQASR